MKRFFAMPPLGATAAVLGASRTCSTAGSSQPQPQERRKGKKFVTAADLDRDEAASISHPEYLNDCKASRTGDKQVSRGHFFLPVRAKMMQSLTGPSGRWVATAGALYGSMPLVSLPVHMRASTAPLLRETTDGPAAVPPAAPEGALFKRTSASYEDASGLLKHADAAVTVGRSAIHGRGLFALRPIPRGTRIITVPQMHFIDALGMMCVQGDSEVASVLGSMWQYIPHQAGAFPFCVTPHPGLLLNHSCDANATCGLSRPFWTEAMRRGEFTEADGTPTERERELVARASSWDSFHDANSYFATRDVAAGEELTLDYTRRISPMYTGELWSENFNPLACSCGATECKGYVYHNAHHLRFEPNGSAGGAEGQAVAARKLLVDGGYDDETVIISLMEDRGPLMRYLHNDDGAAAAGGGGLLGANLPLQQSRYERRWVLASFVQTLGYLNSVPPLYAFHEDEGEEWL